MGGALSRVRAPLDLARPPRVVCVCVCVCVYLREYTGEAIWRFGLGKAEVCGDKKHI